MLYNTDTSYGVITKFFHWLIFILLFFMLLTGFIMDDITNKALHSQVNYFHKLTGISIFFLMIVRFIWTMMNPRPLLPYQTPWYEALLERFVHYLMYFVLVLMPLTGWIMSSAAGKAPKVFNFSIKLPVVLNKPMAHDFATYHYWIAWIVVAVVSLHIFAGLFHFFVRKDEVLQRILPGKVLSPLASEYQKR